MKIRLMTAAAAAAFAMAASALALTGGGKIFSDQGKMGSVEVHEKYRGTFRYMNEDGLLRAWTDDGASRRAHLSLITSSPARKALVIGPGAGAAVDALYFNGAESVDVVMKNPAVIKASALLSDRYSQAFKNPGTKIIYAPPAGWLEKASGKYDAIFLWPAVFKPEEMAPAMNEKTVQKARALLSPEGAATLWIPLGLYKTEEIRNMLSIFVSVFPHVVLWLPELTPELGWAVVSGYNAPPRFDLERIQAKLMGASSVYRFAEEGNAHSLLSFYVTDRGGLMANLKTFAKDKSSAQSLGKAKLPEWKEGGNISVQNYKYLAGMRAPAAGLVNGTEKDSKKLSSYFAARTKMIEGRVLRKTPQGSQESSFYDEAMKLAPDDPNLAALYLSLGKAFLISNLPQKAALYLETAKKIAPNQAATRYYLGRAYEKMTRWEKASAEYEKLKQLEPNFLEPLKDGDVVP